VLAVAPSFGKTVLAAKMIAERGVNTLVIVHSKAMLNQWLSRLPMFLDVSPKDLGVMRGGKKKPTGLIDVALWQSLIRDDVVDDRVANYGQLNIDACHHVAAEELGIRADREGGQGSLCTGTLGNTGEKGWTSSDHFHAVRTSPVSRQPKGIGGEPPLRAHHHYPANAIQVGHPK
jgi:hypothetical protein